MIAVGIKEPRKILSMRDLVGYLAQRELIRLDAVVQGDLEIVGASRRNRNFKVITQKGPSYFIKQGIEPDTKASLAREAALYQFLTRCPTYTRERLAKYLPKYCYYDRQEHILILELQPDSRSLWEHHVGARRFSKSLATAMGCALAELHRLTDSAEVKETLQCKFGADLPWILSLHQPAIGILQRVSAANLKLVKIVQQFGDFRESLERLRLEWQNDYLIHFDVKADNWLVFSPIPGGHRTRLNLVDWELARMGDACWDVGSVFADYLSYWLLSIPVSDENPPEQFLSLARFPLARIQPALSCFWRAYVGRMLLRENVNQWLVRSVRYAAARLLQRSYEQMQISSDLTANTVCCLQVSQNLLQRPAEAAVRLLKLPLEGVTI